MQSAKDFAYQKWSAFTKACFKPVSCELNEQKYTLYVIFLKQFINLTFQDLENDVHKYS